MKCSFCTTEMEEGYLDKGLWIAGKPTYLGGKNVATYPRNSEYANAWLCPHCGKIEIGIYSTRPAWMKMAASKIKKEKARLKQDSSNPEPIPVPKEVEEMPKVQKDEPSPQYIPTPIEVVVPKNPIKTTILVQELPQMKKQRKIILMLAAASLLAAIGNMLIAWLWGLALFKDIVFDNLLRGLFR